MSVPKMLKFIALTCFISAPLCAETKELQNLLSDVVQSLKRISVELKSISGHIDNSDLRKPVGKINKEIAGLGDAIQDFKKSLKGDD